MLVSYAHPGDDLAPLPGVYYSYGISVLPLLHIFLDNEFLTCHLFKSFIKISCYMQLPESLLFTKPLALIIKHACRYPHHSKELYDDLYYLTILSISKIMGMYAVSNLQNWTRLQ